MHRVDPATGEVTHEVDQDLGPVSGAEGVAVLPGPDGSFLHTPDVSWGLRVDFRGYGRS